MTGWRLLATMLAASAIASSSGADLPRIHASPCALLRRGSFGLRSRCRLTLLVVFDVGEALDLVAGVPSSAPPVLAGLPVHDLLDLLRQLEILVGDALGGVVLQPHLDPSIGGGDVGMVPRCLGEWPTVLITISVPFQPLRPILAPDPAALVDTNAAGRVRAAP